MIPGAKPCTLCVVEWNPWGPIILCRKVDIHAENFLVQKGPKLKAERQMPLWLYRVHDRTLDHLLLQV